MMKRFFITAMFLSAILSLTAGTLDKVVLKSSVASAIKNEASSSVVRGYVERIDIGFSSSTGVVSVVVKSSNTLTKVSTTLFSNEKISTNVSFYPRFNGHGTGGEVAFTNSAERYVMLDEVIYLTTTNTVVTNQVTTATVIYDRQ